MGTGLKIKISKFFSGASCTQKKVRVLLHPLLESTLVLLTCNAFLKLWELGHGVIGNTADFGSVIQGSSPCDPTSVKRNCLLIKQLRFFVLGFWYFVGIFKSLSASEKGGFVNGKKITLLAPFYQSNASKSISSSSSASKSPVLSSQGITLCSFFVV